MKHKGNNNYSRREVKSIKTMVDYNSNLSKPVSRRKLATAVAKALNRPVLGVYYKLLSMTEKKPRIKRVAVQQELPLVQKSISFGKPTKIEISENGMTFYF